MQSTQIHKYTNQIFTNSHITTVPLIKRAVLYKDRSYKYRDLEYVSTLCCVLKPFCTSNILWRQQICHFKMSSTHFNISSSYISQFQVGVRSEKKTKRDLNHPKNLTQGKARFSKHSSHRKMCSSIVFVFSLKK